MSDVRADLRLVDSNAGVKDEWAAIDLEDVCTCPVCHSSEVALVHDAVKDWAFQSAPGRWQYWQCAICHSLYLNPRPTPASIARAYSNYYTHAGPGSSIGIRGLKLRWKNERLSARFDRNIEPRLHLPSIFQAAVARKSQRIALPFGWEELAAMNPGRLMDVGCGSGTSLTLAQQLGWNAQGIEMDSAAVTSAREAGLAVEEGGYHVLRGYPSTFDCITCSHVIEHVFDPVDMIAAMYLALKPGGFLLLATPNANSDVHQHFGRFWRGLEAPRHLVIFSEATLIALLRKQGFAVDSRSDDQLETARESARIARGASRASSADRALARRLQRTLKRSPAGHDFIKLLAWKT